MFLALQPLSFAYDHSCNSGYLGSTAEKDKEFFEEKLSAGSIALDVLNQQMHALSLQLESAEETTRIREFSHGKMFPKEIFPVSD